MGTHFEGEEEETRALNSYIKLTRCTEAVGLTVNCRLRDQGVTLSQFGVLEALHFLGPMTVGQLGEKILRSSGNMTMVVDNLVKRGLVRRHRCAEDRRRIDVTLTEEGRALIESIWPQHLNDVVTAFSVLDAEELEQLGALCRKLGLAQSHLASDKAEAKP